MKELILIVVIFTCLHLEGALGDGYGHGGGHTYMMPSGGGGRKWQIRAKGKGMQNMMAMQQHYPKKEEKKQEVVYYPVPVYTPSHDSYGGGGGYESKHEMSIIPIYGGGHGGGYGGGHGYGGHGGYGGGDYGGYH